MRCIRYALLAGQAHLLAVEHVRCDIGVLCCRTGRLLETRFGEGVLAQRLGARRLQRALPLRLELAGSGRISVATLCKSDVNGSCQSMVQTNHECFFCSSNCLPVAVHSALGSVVVARSAAIGWPIESIVVVVVVVAFEVGLVAFVFENFDWAV